MRTRAKKQTAPIYPTACRPARCMITGLLAIRPRGGCAPVTLFAQCVYRSLSTRLRLRVTGWAENESQVVRPWDLRLTGKSPVRLTSAPGGSVRPETRRSSQRERRSDMLALRVDNSLVPVRRAHDALPYR